MRVSTHKILFIIWLFSAVLYNKNASAQCSSTQINWDYQYYRTTNLPASGINFMLGKNTMAMTWASATFGCPVDEHTASAANGDDLKFTVGNGSITLTFLEEVSNLTFTVYGIDNKQKFSPTAVNAANAAKTITLSRVTGVAGTLLPASPLGVGTAPSYTYTNAVALNSNVAAVNVTIPGPVKKVVLTFTKSSGTDPIYISDISACTNSTWATDYQMISAPETGQPTHMLVSYDKTIYVINKSDNTAVELYTDPSPTMTILNTMAYDPYKQVIYYCDSKRDVGNKTVFKYDVKTGVKSIFIADVNALGIQTFTFGLATAGSGFYDGYLFLGTDSDEKEGTPVAIYRIDIDSVTGAALRASRFWAANGVVTNIVYDWGDFVVNDGVLYNFNAAPKAAAGTSLEHYDLNMQTRTANYSYGAIGVDTLSQASLDYEGNIFSVKVGSYYQKYDKVGGFGPKIYYSGIPAGKVLTDGAESFKYPYDYGDAPSAYGYASHVFRVSPNLTIGTKIDYEMKGFYSADALADDDDGTSDEDGVNPTYFTSNPLMTSNTSYSVPVIVRNTTGANAYMYAYIDFNSDGDFNDAGERSQLITVPNGALSVTVTWIGLTAGKAGNSYIRFRLAIDAADISAGSGYAKSGEVEDYPITIQGSNLPVELISFTAIGLENKTTELNWATASEFNNNYFEVQRSTEPSVWEVIGVVVGKGNSHGVQNYALTDEHPKNGINYYRLKQVDLDTKFEYSSVVAVKFDIKESTVATEKEISVYPNPTVGEVWVKTNGNITENSTEQIDLYNTNGQQLYSAPHNENTQKVDLKYYESGMYYLKIGNQSFRIIKQ